LILTSYSNKLQREFSTSKISFANNIRLKHFRVCEKLSEVFKAKSRTFCLPELQSAPRSIIALHRGKTVPLAKRTRITIDTDSLLILRGTSTQRIWCPACSAQVESIAMEQTGVVSNLDQAALEEWLNSEQFHRLPTTDGSALICLNSLIARVQKVKTS
jgi:hypothetical protein